MSGHSSYTPSNGFSRWLDDRLPIVRLAHDSFVSYPTPRNLNYFWTFGGILSLMLVAQIITGIVLVMHYTPESTMAFNSVEHIMRDVNYGWLLRYLHANGASMFFLAVYMHMFRGLYYGSYKAPREVHGVCFAMGTNELLGREGDHQLVLCHSSGRRQHNNLVVGRLFGRQSNAKPILLAALFAAIHDCRCGYPACLGSARGWTEQSVGR